LVGSKAWQGMLFSSTRSSKRSGFNWIQSQPQPGSVWQARLLWTAGRRVTGAAWAPIAPKLPVCMGKHGESQEQRAERKAAVKATKASKRLTKSGQGDPGVGRKPCTLCDKPRDLLIRCQVDTTGKWHMACGRCWMRESGGQVDGSKEKPNYKYGGLWKNHHAQVTGRHQVPEGASGMSSGSQAHQAAPLLEGDRHDESSSIHGAAAASGLVVKQAAPDLQVPHRHGPGHQRDEQGQEGSTGGTQTLLDMIKADVADDST